MAIRLAIFDLDGTLIDSKLDLAHAVNAARADLGLPPLANELVYSYVGDGAPVLVRRALGPGAPEADIAHALEFFLAYYRAHMLDNTVLYPGVRSALDALLSSGVAMAVLTNKPVRISREIVDRLELGTHFRAVYGGNSFEFKKPNAVGIDRLREECGAGREETLMIGDSGVDIQTARNAGVLACGVTYGFQPETFAEWPPDFLLDRMDELPERIIGR